MPSIGKMLGVQDPAVVAEAKASGLAIINARNATKSASSNGGLSFASGVALGNQTGANTMGFTYE